MKLMYGDKAVALVERLKQEGIIGAKGAISLRLLGVTVDVSDKSAVGNLLQEWLGRWMDEKGIYRRNNENSQMPPDFYLGEDNMEDWLEVKSFDHEESPNFDVANFDAYTRDLRTRAFRLDADYLVLGYSLKDGVIEIKDIWLKKVWEITCPSNEYALRTQVKQGQIVNIRPYNFKSNPNGFKAFGSRLVFVTAIKDTLSKYRNDAAGADEWFKEVETSYAAANGSPL